VWSIRVEWVNYIGVGVVALFAGLLILSVLGLLAVILFWKTRKIIIPRVTLLLVTGLEVPIKKIGKIFKVDGVSIDRTVMNMRNLLDRRAYSGVPYNMRAVFMPQCLRHPECPARLNSEGIQCINCGLCGLGEIKREAESEGMLFFIAPGGSLIKRMIEKHQPKAVLGVGCVMEVKEGGASMAAVGMPARTVNLDVDGCVDTRVDVKRDLDAMFLTDQLEGAHHISRERLAEISSRWTETKRVGEQDKEVARLKYLEAEKKIIGLHKID